MSTTSSGWRRPQDFAELVADELSDVTPAQAALAWVVQQPGVTTVIPGARSTEQVRANAAAGSVDALPSAFLDGVAAIYDRHLRESIHPRW